MVLDQAKKTFVEKTEKLPKKIEGGKARWNKFRMDTKRYYDKHKNGMSKLFEEAKKSGSDKVTGLKSDYLKEMKTSVEDVIDSNEATKTEMAVYKYQLSTKTEKLRKDFEKEKVTGELKKIKELFDTQNLRIDLKPLVNVYINLPRIKKIPITKIRDLMKGVFDREVDMGERIFNKTLKANKTVLYTAFNHLCMGNRNAADKALKQIKNELQFEADCEKIQKISGLDKLARSDLNGMMSALVKAGVKREKVGPFLLKNIEKLKKLDRENFDQIVKTSKSKELSRLLLTAVVGISSGTSENVKQGVRLTLKVEGAIGKAKADAIDGIKKNTEYLKDRIESLKLYRKAYPKETINKTTLRLEKEVSEGIDLVNHYRKLFLKAQAQHITANAYLSKKGLNPVDKKVQKNIDDLLDTENAEQIIKLCEWKLGVHPVPSQLQMLRAAEFKAESSTIDFDFRGHFHKCFKRDHIESSKPEDWRWTDSIQKFYKTGKMDYEAKKNFREHFDKKGGKQKRLVEKYLPIINDNYQETFLPLKEKYKKMSKVPKAEIADAGIKMTGHLSLMRNVHSTTIQVLANLEGKLLTLSDGEEKKDTIKWIAHFKKIAKDLANKINEAYDFLGKKKDKNLLTAHENAVSPIHAPLVLKDFNKEMNGMDSISKEIAAAAVPVSNIGKNIKKQHEQYAQLVPTKFEEGLKSMDNLLSILKNGRQKALAIHKKLNNELKATDSLNIPSGLKSQRKVILNKILDNVEHALNHYDSPLSVGFHQKIKNKRADLLAAKEKYEIEGFVKGVALACLMAAAIGAAVAGGMAAGAIGTKLFGSAAAGTVGTGVVPVSAGVASFATGGLSMMGVAAGSVIGSRAVRLFFTHMGLLDMRSEGVDDKGRKYRKDILDLGDMFDEYAFSLVMSLAAVGAAKGLMKGLKHLATAKYYKLRFPGLVNFSQRALDKMGLVGKIAKPSAWFQGGREGGKSGFLRHFGREVAEESGEEAVEEAAERIHPVLGFMASVANASDGCSVNLAMHGLKVGDIGIKFENNVPTFTTKTPQEFVTNLNSQFGPDTAFTHETTINADGSVTLVLFQKVKNKTTGKTRMAKYKMIDIKPAQLSENLTPEVEISRVNGVELGKNNKLKLIDSDFYSAVVDGLTARGFLITKNADGTILTITKGDVSYTMEVDPAKIVESKKEKVEENKDSIGKALKRGGKRLAAAWKTFNAEFKGDYEAFAAANPRLAKLIPKVMYEVAPLALTVIAGICGVPALGMVVANTPELAGAKLSVNSDLKDFKKVEIVERHPDKHWIPLKVAVTKADGTVEIIAADTAAYVMTTLDGRQYSVPITVANHIKRLHIDNVEAGSGFKGKKLEDIMIDIVSKIGTKDAVEKEPNKFSIDMGTTIGEDAVASLKELVQDGVIGQEEVDNLYAVKDQVFQLNKEGSDADKQAFVDKFNADNSGSKIKLIIARSGVIVPEVNAPKKNTSKMMVIFGDDGKGGLIMKTTSPGRFMPRHPKPNQFDSEEGGTNGDAYKEAQTAWIENVFLKGITPEGQNLMNEVGKGDILASIQSGKVDQDFPKLAKLLEAQGENGKRKAVELLLSLRASTEYKALIKADPSAKTILELTTLMQHLNETKTNDGNFDATETAAKTDKLLDSMNIPKDIREKVGDLIKYRDVLTKLAEDRVAVASGEKKNPNNKLMNPEKISDIILDKRVLKYLQVLSSNDLSLEYAGDKKKLALMKAEIGKLHDEVATVYDACISLFKINLFTERNRAKLEEHSAKMSKMSLDEKLKYVEDLHKTNPVESVSLAHLVFNNIDLHDGTPKEATLENIKAYSNNEAAMNQCLATIAKIRQVKDTSLQHSLMQVLFKENPALYTAAMEKLTYNLDPEISAKNKDAKLESIKSEFKTQAERAALDKLAHRIQHEIVGHMLETHALGYGGMLDTIQEGGRQGAHQRRSQGLEAKSTKGDDFKLAGSLSVFTYKGAFWDQKDVFATISPEYMNSDKGRDAYFLTEDYVLKPPSRASMKKEGLRKSFDEKLKDVMNRQDVKEYTAYKIAAYMMQQAKATGVKVENIPYMDIRLNLVNYFRRNSNTEELPASKLGGRPEGHIRHEVPIHHLEIKVPKRKVSEQIEKQKKKLKEFEQKGRADMVVRTQRVIDELEVASKINPDMSLKEFYLGKIQEAIQTYEAKVKSNPDDKRAKAILESLRKFKPDNIKEYEPGGLSKENQFRSAEYVESIFGVQLSGDVQLREYERISIVNIGTEAYVHMPEETLSRFTKYLTETREGGGIPKIAVKIEDGKVVIDKSQINDPDFSVRTEVRNFLNKLPGIIKAEQAAKKPKQKPIHPNLKPLGPILKANIKEVNNIYERLQHVKDNPKALEGIVNGLLKRKLKLTDEQVKAVLDTLKD